MINARRRTKLKSVDKDSKPNNLYLIFSAIAVILLLILGSSLYFIFNAFSSNNVVVAKFSNGNHTIKSYDLEDKTITELSVPQNVYVNAALQRGSWRLESVVKIIESENLDKQMYANTIMKSLNVPVDHWIFNGRSSLNLFQRINLMFLDLTLPSKSKSGYTLAETSFLTESELPDGEAGYVIEDELPADIKQSFLDDQFSANGYRIEIDRHIDINYSSSSDLIEILTTMGSHVVNVRREESQDINCHIQAKEGVDLDRIKSIFDCTSETITEGNLDMRISIGNKFAEKF